MNTDEIMALALSMADFQKIPADSEIHVPGDGIKKILFGIDIGPAELLMAKDQGYDLVVAHHPVGGRSRLEAWQVFQRHVDQMIEAGIPEEVAREAIRRKISILEHEAHSTNYDHLPSLAKHLQIPFMNIHNPLDELGRKRVTQEIRALFSVNKDATVSDVMRTISNLSEFQRALTEVRLGYGTLPAKAGKTVFSHAAYTNGGYDVAKTYHKYGIDTVIYIHISEPDLAKLRADRVGNLIITGHIASDCVGIAPFISKLRNMGLKVDAISGIIPA